MSCRRYGFSKQSKQDKVGVSQSSRYLSDLSGLDSFPHLPRPVSLLQVDERKASLAGGSQATPPGMAEVSEEDALQAAEEVSTVTQ